MLVLLTLASLLVACDSNVDIPDQPDENTDPVSETTQGALIEETDPPETEAPKPDFVMSPNNTYRIVYSDEYANLGSSNKYVRRIMQFTSSLKKETGILFTRATDFTKDGMHDADTVEIVIGDTTYEESKKVGARLTYSNYAIAIEGNKLVICGYSDDALDEAMTRATELVKSCTKDGVITIPGDTFIVENLKNAEYDLPVYTAGNFETIYQSGGNGDMFVIRETSLDEYKAYLTVLENLGYTQYTATDIAANSFATYNNATHTVNVGYYDYEKSVRIIIEPLTIPVGLESDVKYTAVTTPSITLLGCEYDKGGGSYSHTGLSMIIRLKDGSFVIVDGGHGRVEKADQLLKALKELSGSYRKSGEKIVISDWIVTHPHDDHYYMLLDYYNKFTADCTVKRIVANIISDEERAVAMAKYPDSRQNNTCARWSDLYKVADAFGSYVQFVRTGQVLYEAGLKMEVLYTIDSFGPRICNAVNTTSLVMKMIFDDGTTFMMTGDATGNAMEICAKMYGDYLRSDILQVSHHGSSTWSNDNGVAMAYELIAPTTLLWPTNKNFYNSSKKYAYNAVLFAPESNGKNRNYKEVFYAGAEYNAHTTPIPLVVGSTNSWKIN